MGVTGCNCTVVKRAGGGGSHGPLGRKRWSGAQRAKWVDLGRGRAAASSRRGGLRKGWGCSQGFHGCCLKHCDGRALSALRNPGPDSVC